MEFSPDAAHRKAAREATEWLVLLAEDPHDRELLRIFEEWRASDPLHAKVWQATEQMAHVTRSMTPALKDQWAPYAAASSASAAAERDRDDGAPVAVPGRRAASSRGIGRKLRVGMAALAMAAVVALVAPTVLLNLRADFSTSTGELRNVVLADGSEVYLAPGSAISVDIDDRERRIGLLAGEAFFAVRTDLARPFRVIAGDVETRVVGTRFNVRRDDVGVTVSVEQGIVEVGETAHTGAVQRLERGRTLHLSWNGKATTQQRDPEAVAAWRKGLLLSDDEPLRQAVAQLSRYYEGTIVLMDQGLGERPVTGVFELQHPEAALRAIAQAHQARVRQISPWVLVISSR